MRRLLALLLWLGCAYAGSLAVFALSLGSASGQPSGAADAIVVLTGGTDRVERALRLLAEDFSPILLVTGAHPGTDTPQALRRAGADADLAPRVVLGYRARSTRGNAAEVAEFAAARGLRRLIVVTSTYHMPRALAELRQGLPGIGLDPVAVEPVGGTPVELVLSEHAKWLLTVSRMGRLLPAREV